MSLSSVTGASSILQPGVCTSTTRPASPYDGQVIYETDTDKVAVYDSSSWVYKTGTSHVAPALIQVVPTSVAVTGGSATGSVDTNGNITFALATGIIINGIFSASYDYYHMRVSITACSGNDDNVEIRYTTGGTANANTSYQGQRLEVSGTTVSGAAQTGLAQQFIGSASSTDGDTPFGLFDLLDPFASKVTKCSSNWYSVNNSAVQKSVRTNSIFDNTTSFDGIAFRLAGLTGPTMSGNISVYGYRK